MARALPNTASIKRLFAYLHGVCHRSEPVVAQRMERTIGRAVRELICNVDADRGGLCEAVGGGLPA
jgi:hypothetical protein